MSLETNTVKKHLQWIICTVIGSLHFIFLAFPWASEYLYYHGAKQKVITYSGYNVLFKGFSEKTVEIVDAPVGGFFAFGAEWLAFFAAIFLIVSGICLLVRTMFTSRTEYTQSPFFHKLFAVAVHSYSICIALVIVAYCTASLLTFKTGIIEEQYYSTGIAFGVGAVIALACALLGTVSTRFLRTQS